ncbi:acyltransferase family protein [Paramicrobacterium agarici]|uniref:Peptidoglycan/LPS O-acetylase OafA/YrhL n=1 Tax=Paramicrobacterium agarici TaxID=630514 RepID=A0A2A9DXT6_9MICO|nr:acyltransferase family protein [Microbacterium agarici]PFG31151.1 peptidoglycan/LPS O-acetylase OafA/YrhL [Microbacterium agarici]
MAGDPLMSQQTSGRTTEVRTDIQGLRAIAVGIVVIFHFVPAALPGGYVGVDVFFVISGFLITTHLLREMNTTSRINLPRFWARRARRLLPAALLVLALTVGAVWLFVPTGFKPDFLAQVAASALYGQNWMLADQAVDYLAAEAQASPVQHYWSLSTEEQFYIVWPLLMVLALWIASRAKRARPARSVGFVIGAVAVLSFGWSVWQTAFDPAAAYFVTTTRAWEFALGGLTALAVLSRPALFAAIPEQVRSVLAWLGLGGIFLSALVYTGETPFPGYTALLPVLATIAVIIAHDPSPAWSPRRLLAVRPMQWLGDVSYSVYLWHFPLIILAPFVLRRTVNPIDLLVITALTLVLAWASKEWVEDPVRIGITSSWRPRITFAATAAAMGAVVVVTIGGIGAADEQVKASQQKLATLVESNEPCFGAAALEPGSGCVVEPDTVAVPDPALVDKSPERCITNTRDDELKVCEYGVEKEDADQVIALVGDSHTEQWLSAMMHTAEKRNWHVTVLTKASCPFIGVPRDEPEKSNAEVATLVDTCTTWNDEAKAYLDEHTEIDTVVTSAKSSNPVEAEDGESWQETAIDSYEERWSELPEHISSIIAVRDTPRMNSDVLSCVTANGKRAGEECARSVDDAFSEDPLAEAAEQSTDSRVSLIDMSEYFIVDEQVPPVIGGVLAFRDTHHISWVYSSTLAAPFGDKIDEVVETAAA